jgi:serine phosphatase RsbU (regulator of sigma subunit)
VIGIVLAAMLVRTRGQGWWEAMRISLASLRSRLLLLVLLALVPVLGLMLWTAAEQRRLAAAEVQENALRLARLASLDQERLIESTRQLLVVLAQLPEVRRGDPAACGALLAVLLQQYPLYTNLGTIAPDGNLVCSALPTSGPINVADRAYFRRALDTRAFAVGEYQIGRVTGKASVGFGYPVVADGGRVEAVVFTALDLDWLNRLAGEVQLPAGSTLTVIDRNGTVLARYPDATDWVGQTVPEAPIVREMLAQQRAGTTEAPGLDGMPRYFAFTPLGGSAESSNVYISIGIPTAVVLAESNRLLGRQVAGLGLVGALALAAAWIGGEIFILRRVRALVGATRRLGAGDLSARTGLPHDQGELGHLARAFDDMAESLQEQHEQRLVQEQIRLQLATLLGELARAAEVQAGLLPREAPALTGFELAARCVPAREVGGDFYDWQAPAPGSLTLTLGDVMGKGMPAALLMATARAVVRAVARQNRPAVTLDLAERALEADFERSGSFITLFHAQLDLAARRLAYVDAGHGHVFVRRGDGTAEELRPRGLPLNVLPDLTYQEGALTFQAGDALVLYSDGLVDARPDLTLDRHALAERLDGAASAAEMVDRLVALAELTGPPPDDLTLLVLRCCDGAAPAAPGPAPTP